MSFNHFISKLPLAYELSNSLTFPDGWRKSNFILQEGESLVIVFVLNEKHKDFSQNIVGYNNFGFSISLKPSGEVVLSFLYLKIENKEVKEKDIFFEFPCPKTKLNQSLKYLPVIYKEMVKFSKKNFKENGVDTLKKLLDF